MPCRDPFGLPLTTGPEAADAWSDGLLRLLALQAGGAELVSRSLALDPTFALGHATLALLAHERCLPVDLPARMRDAELHARRGSDRERSHVHAVLSHVRGDSRPLLRHLVEHPTDALLLDMAVPTIAFAGVTEVPEQAWALVEGAAPAYGDHWWAQGLLAFVRQEQGRFDEAMDLSCRSLAVTPAAGHSAHARAHDHYETGDHGAGLRWMDSWVTGEGRDTLSLSHFSWHAALHELSLGDTDAERRRHDAQLRPDRALGCRALVDTGSLLLRWALTADGERVPGLEEVVEAAGRDALTRPSTPFLAMHSAVVLLAVGDVEGLRSLARHSERHDHPVHREVVAPVVHAFVLLVRGLPGLAADCLEAVAHRTWRLGGSDAQREVLEEVRIAALLRAGRLAEAASLLDARLDRRDSPRDRAWRRRCTAAPEG
ncbi:pyridine nucleotide-disulfide oxidoreductase [Nocardioides solisilvae]|uniref:pyridine nucleotide-disulfide oxidoreductase n=1 Tax=Nocardioides solisilvae TaxID=1542435 RepID=UPI000D745CA9|nr:pyridine nucleotide-disulfide oxidoreductase [Nocardioides solisilvae]